LTDLAVILDEIMEDLPRHAPPGDLGATYTAQSVTKAQRILSEIQKKK
jgi:hypothetical protein